MTTKTRRRRAVLAICLMLLARGDCFHIGSSQCSQAHAHVPASRSRASSSSPLEPRHALVQEGTEGAEDGVPGLLRDVVIEKIEELGGGKVQQVRSSSCWSCSCLWYLCIFILWCFADIIQSSFTDSYSCSFRCYSLPEGNHTAAYTLYSVFLPHGRSMLQKSVRISSIIIIIMCVWFVFTQPYPIIHET